MMNRRLWRSALLLLLLATSVQRLSAADVRWIGGAMDVPQIDTSTASGTFADGETVFAAINGQTTTVTVIGSAFDTSDAALALATAINANSGGTATEYSYEQGGQEFGEFRDVVASASGAVLTVKSRLAGTPYTITFGDTAGSGAMGATVSVQAATGKNWFTNTANWEGGSLPAAADRLVFSHVSVSVLYGLANTTLDYQLTIDPSYQADLGLAAVNQTHSGHSYSEYRGRFLVLPITDTTGTATHYLAGQGLRLLDFGSNNGAGISVYLRSSDPRSTSGAAVQLVGGVEVSLFAAAGAIDVGSQLGETVTNLLKVETTLGAPDVRIGTNATFVNLADSMILRAGSLTLEADCAGANNEIHLHGGQLTILETADVQDLFMFGGEVDYRGPLMAQLAIYGGTFDASRCTATTFVTNVDLFTGAKFFDPQNVLGASLDFNGCSVSDVELQLRDNLTLIPVAALSPSLE